MAFVSWVYSGYVAAAPLQCLWCCSTVFAVFSANHSDIFALCVWIYLDRVYFRLLYYAVLLRIII